MRHLFRFQADPSIDFVTGLPILADWEDVSYDSIPVIVDRLTNMVHYKPVKVTINTPGLAEVILDVVVPARLNRNRWSLSLHLEVLICV